MNKMKYLAGCDEQSVNVHYGRRHDRSPRYFILFMDSSLLRYFSHAAFQKSFHGA